MHHQKRKGSFCGSACAAVPPSPQRLRTTPLDPLNSHLPRMAPLPRVSIGQRILEQSASLNLGDFLTLQEKVNLRCANPREKAEGKAFLHEPIFLEQAKMQRDFSNLPRGAVLDVEPHEEGHRDGILRLRRIASAIRMSNPSMTVQLRGDWTYVEIVSMANICEELGVSLRMTPEVQRVQSLFRVLFEQPSLKHPSGGYGVLHLSVVCNSLANLYYFFEQGADVNAVEFESRKTALHLAAQGGLSEVVETLVSRPDCNINQTDSFDETPLSLALESGHGSIGEYLISRGGRD